MDINKDWVPYNPEWMLIDNGELQHLRLIHVLDTIPAKDLDLRFSEFALKVKLGGMLEIRGLNLELLGWHLGNFMVDREKAIENLFGHNRVNCVSEQYILKKLLELGFTVQTRDYSNYEYIINAKRNS